MEIRSPSLPARALRKQGVKFPVTTSTPSPQTLSPFLRGRKSVQTHLISRDDTGSTFSESHSRMRSWLSEAPPMLLRSRSFLEREHQPRDQYWEIPKDVDQARWLGKQRNHRTYTVVPLLCGEN